VGEAATAVVVVTVAAGANNDAPPAVCDQYFRTIIPAAF
jgi:hypothetical protein